MAFHNVGAKCVFASEIDKYARSIYARQFNGSIQLGDVTGIGNDLGEIDLITGGFPCQTFSIAGKREGFADIRGTLFFKIVRLAGFYRPRYMVLENVKGLLSHDSGNTIRIILDELRRLDYFTQLLVLNTKDFNVPQNRERCFFICSASRERRPEIFHLRERKTKIDFSSNCIDANYYKGIDNHGQRTCVGTLRTHKDGEGFREMQSGICPTIPARGREDGSGQPIIAIPCLSPDRVDKRLIGRRFKENGDPMFTLTAQDRHGVMYRSVKLQNSNMLGRRFKSENDPSFCLSSQDQTGVFDGLNIRRLTPIECERLQAFPDDWTKYGKDGELISDSQRYKCLGNSVTVKVIEEIAKCIKEVL